MERIGRFDRLSALAEKRMRRGVLTNTLITRETYEPDIRRGALTALETEHGLFLLRDRGDRALLSFLMEPGAPLPALPDGAVCEIAFRERDTGLAALPERFEAAGFETALRRIRLARPAGPCGPPEEPLCSPESPEEAGAFLRGHFSSLTGCLPGEEELRDAFAGRRLLAVRERDTLCGLIHFSVSGKQTQIRHLAVGEGSRGRGLAGRLIRGFLAETGGMRSAVWTGEENIPAVRAYLSAGYSPDGARSAVLFKGRTV